MEQYSLFTNDVETTSLWHNTLRDETGLKVYKVGMPALLDLYARHNIKSTFFFTGYIAKLVPDVVKMIVNDGHEVASHGMSHLKKNGFDVMPYDKQLRHLKESKALLEDISGQEVVSFRAPALRVSNNTALALAEAGYKIDSSIASQRFDMFFSFGSIKKLNWLTAPRLPYRTDSNNLFKKGKGQIIEIPVSATIMPYVSTTMRIFPTLTAIQRRVLAFETTKTGKPIVFLIHPHEFVDESNEKFKIHSRSSNPLAYFWQDYLRRQLKVKNLGKNCGDLYEKELAYFNTKKFKSVTVKEYCKTLSL
ncbi:MAG: polysaccharide deacetylase family protein [Bacteroidia bacterium]